ncbi:MAG: hypothetical protein AAB597_00250 [Patescibacteria group bacterium]
MSFDVRQFLTRVQSFILPAVVFVLPWLFIPVLDSPIQWTNAAIISMAGVVVVSIYIFLAFREGRLILPRSPLLLSIFLLPVATAISAVFSSHPSAGLYGIGFEEDTALTLFLFSLLFLGASLVNSRRSILNILLGLIFGGSLLFIFLFLRVVFGADFLSFGVFPRLVNNPLGAWTDMGIFAGLFSLLLLSLLSFLPVTGFFRHALSSGVVLSVLALIFVNLERGWWFVYLSFLLVILYFVYRAGSKKFLEISIYLWPLTLALAVSFVFVTLRGPIGGVLNPLLLKSGVDLVNFEARPSWQSTFSVIKSSVSENPVLGSGPNRFFLLWQKNHPVETNQTIYWNTDFNFGLGIVLTALATGGLLLGLAWLVFLGLFFYGGARLLAGFYKERNIDPFIFSTFFVSLYLWLAAIFYAPKTSVFALAFIFTGLHIATLRASGKIGIVGFSKDVYRKIFPGTLLFLSVLVVVPGLFFVSRALAFGIFNYGTHIYTEAGDSSHTKSLIKISSNIAFSDLYARALSGVAIRDIQQVLQNSSPSSLESDLPRLQTLIHEAEEAAVLAAKLDPENYLNAIAAGSLYETLVSLKVPKAYENARGAYAVASEDNPQNPLPLLSLARLEVLSGKADSAVGYINQALVLKTNYTEALLLASEIARVKGNISEAVAATLLAAEASGDPAVYYRAGILQFNGGNYQSAIENFNRALSLLPAYSNARYFLGLSYGEVGDIEHAIGELERVAADNPGNQDVLSAILNLKSASSSPVKR